MAQTQTEQAAPIEARPTELLSTLACFNKACGDELRLQILRVLHQDSYGVMELASVFDTRQSGMSHHLKVLATAGLVSRRREGNSIFYSRSYSALEPELAALQQHLLDLADELALPPEIEQRLKAVQSERANLSRGFFEQHAGEFTQQQEQISEFSVYSNPIIALLDQLPAARRNSVLEIGPGSGQLLEPLSHRFQKVIALDNSQEMLESAIAHCQQSGTCNNEQIEFIRGDTGLAVQRSLQVQNIVLNMVLHHVPSPAEILGDISKLLDSEGQLFIAELCDHDQDWVRESCGDLWLGVAPANLNKWLLSNGMREAGNGQYITLRNGFRVQIRQFSKSKNLTPQLSVSTPASTKHAKAH